MSKNKWDTALFRKGKAWEAGKGISVGVNQNFNLRESRKDALWVHYERSIKIDQICELIYKVWDNINIFRRGIFSILKDIISHFIELITKISCNYCLVPPYVKFSVTTLIAYITKISGIIPAVTNYHIE